MEWLQAHHTQLRERIRLLKADIYEKECHVIEYAKVKASYITSGDPHYRDNVLRQLKGLALSLDCADDLATFLDEAA